MNSELSVIQFQNEQKTGYINHKPLYASPFRLSNEDEVNLQLSFDFTMKIMNRIQAVMKSKGYEYYKIRWSEMLVYYKKPNE